MGGSDVDGTGGTLGDRSTVWKEKFLNDLVMVVTSTLMFHYAIFENFQKFNFRAKNYLFDFWVNEKVHYFFNLKRNYKREQRLKFLKI